MAHDGPHDQARDQARGQALPPPGSLGHGRGIVSIRRQAGGTVARDPETDEWVMAFEVICPDCGDTGSAFAEQTPEVQTVRGPYAGQTEAQFALLRHVGQDDD